MSLYMNQYQVKADEYALYTKKMYPVASLMVEAAELADLFIKPLLRGDDVEIERADIVSEAGDVLWNLCAILSDHGIPLDEVAISNLKKLERRQKDGTIQGSGNR